MHGEAERRDELYDRDGRQTQLVQHITHHRPQADAESLASVLLLASLKGWRKAHIAHKGTWAGSPPSIAHLTTYQSLHDRGRLLRKHLILHPEPTNGRESIINLDHPEAVAHTLQQRWGLQCQFLVYSFGVDLRYEDRRDERRVEHETVER